MNANAALQKGQELVEFSWDSRDMDGVVTVYYYDYSAETNDAYNVVEEAAPYARRLWQGLIEAGFTRKT